jgi:hypothetical protein
VVIFKGIRYEQVPIIEATDIQGRTVVAIGLRPTPPTPAGFVHRVTESDRLDLLAYRYYRNPEKFWLLADANAGLDPLDLVRRPGDAILVPPDRGTGG